MVVTWDLSVLKPSEASFDVVHASIDGGRSISGLTRAIDVSGGGFWRVEFNRIALRTPTQHRLWNKYAGILSGGVEQMYIPLPTYWLDTAALTGSIVGPYDAGDATVIIDMITGTLEGGEIFAINHGSTWGFRSYRILEIDSEVSTVYTLSIDPPLRRPIGTATGGLLEIDFVEPRLVARLAPGESAEWRPYGWRQADPSVTFVEWFPGT